MYETIAKLKTASSLTFKIIDWSKINIYKQKIILQGQK